MSQKCATKVTCFVTTLKKKKLYSNTRRKHGSSSIRTSSMKREEIKENLSHVKKKRREQLPYVKRKLKGNKGSEGNDRSVCVHPMFAPSTYEEEEEKKKKRKEKSC